MEKLLERHEVLGENHEHPIGTIIETWVDANDPSNARRVVTLPISEVQAPEAVGYPVGKPEPQPSDPEPSDPEPVVVEPVVEVEPDEEPEPEDVQPESEVKPPSPAPPKSR